MRYRPDHKNATRAVILKAGGEVFRAKGFAGIGVDGLAKAAKLTSGAFYKHFNSKIDAFREVVTAGMQRVVARIRYVQGARSGANEQEEWIDDFIFIYTSRAHRDAAAEGCRPAELDGRCLALGSGNTGDLSIGPARCRACDDRASTFCGNRRRSGSRTCHSGARAGRDQHVARFCAIPRRPIVLPKRCAAPPRVSRILVSQAPRRAEL